MKFIAVIFTFCFLFFAFQLSATDTWVKTYNPFREQYFPGMGWIEFEVDYFVEDVLVTQDSGYVVSGSFDRWIDDDPPFWFDHWGFLMKTDCDGNLLWAKGDSVVFLSENDNYACVETEDGDLISIGYCYWGGGYMIKRDFEGNRLWEIPYDDFGANSMCKTNDGNIILGGVVESEIALRKLDDNGNTLWTKSYNCGHTSIAQSITQTSDNGFALTGLASGNGYDIIVMKTDSVGDSLWVRTFDGFGESDQGNCIIETNDGNYIVVGRLRFIFNYGGVIIKYNTNGDTLWTKVEPSAINNNFYSVVSIEDGIVSYGTGNSILTNLYKYNCEGDSIWFHCMPKFSGYGDRCLRNLPGAGFIAVGALHSYTSPEVIHLTKTDENGNVSVNDPGSQNNIVSINIFPNPIIDNCTISFNNNITLKEPYVTVYNIKGQKIRELEAENNVLGINEVMWDGKDFYGKTAASGIYFCIIRDGENEVVRKMVKLTSP